VSIGVRTMRTDDLPAADRILSEAFGGFSHVARIDALLRQRDARALVAECEGQIAGVVFGNDYVTSGYVSLMGVAEAFRRRGVASRLMDELVAWSDARGLADLRLDATAAGAAVYANYGFVEVAETLVLQRTEAAPGAPPLDVRVARAFDAPAIRALDARAFGADRTALLEQLLAERTMLIASGERGYAALNFAENAAVIGPWIAEDTAAAYALLEAGMSRLAAAADIRLFVPSTNAAALECAREAGFEPQRALRHMIRGRAELPGATLFGRANLGQG
jgi:ribosomal protein S18 acetylase RimI-like enzyme